MRASFARAALLLITLSACGAKTDTATTEPLLKEKDREFIATAMEGASRDVRLVLFTGGGECEYCDATRQFLEEIAAQSPLISTESLSLEKNASRAKELGIDKAPGIALLGDSDYGLRYFGFPTGYEFITFVETVRMVSDGEALLQDETKEKLAALAEPVRITVFSTKS